jgi:D-alanine transaminase
MSDTTCYLNGQYLPLSEARISPLDRGFLFADGVYEVIPVYARVPFRGDEHMARFQKSFDGIGLANPHSADEWKAIIAKVIEQADFDDQAVYLQVTRGADVKRDAAFPKTDVKPTVFVFTAPMVKPSAAMRENGVTVVSAPDIRWTRCNYKTVSLLPNAMTRQISAAAGATETVMFRDGFLTEGSASNIFVVKNGVILAVPQDNRILAGITYDVVIELAKKHGARYEVRMITETEVRSADELWVTSSTKEVLPITTLDGKAVGHGASAGKPGPVTLQMHAWYVAFRDQVTKGARA